MCIRMMHERHFSRVAWLGGGQAGRETHIGAICFGAPLAVRSHYEPNRHVL